jgi:hypothetical protein
LTDIFFGFSNISNRAFGVFKLPLGFLIGGFGRENFGPSRVARVVFRFKVSI